jgi:tetratricopeptide (TPR) repeat protein
MKIRVPVIAAFVLITSLSARGQVATGDQHYARRAEGARGAAAQATQIDAAIAAYRRAIAQNSNDLEARWKLLRAIRFKSAYVENVSQRKASLGDAKKIGEQSLAIVDRLLAQKGIKSVAKATEKQIADAARSIPNAGELFFWDSVVWGEWAIAYGKMAAVKQGAADRIKRGSTIAMLIDPKLENGGGARVLGRLHNQTPRVPFLTGWASDDLAVKYLSQSLSVDPNNKLTKVFLAEAMVASDGKKKSAAVKLLRDVINNPNDPLWAVEDAAAQNDARALLESWK